MAALGSKPGVPTNPSQLPPVIPSVIFPIEGSSTLGKGYIAGLDRLSVLYVLCGIGCWYLCRAQMKETSWFRVVLIPSTKRWISQRERHSDGMTEAGGLRMVLDIEIRHFEHERRLAGPSPETRRVHASRERDTPRHGCSDDTLLGQASNRGCVGAVPLPAGNLGPPPVLGAFLAESETKRASLPAEGRAWEGAPMVSRAAEVQRAAGTEEWRAGGIPVPNQLANAQVGAADFGRYYPQAFIQQQPVLQLAETVRLEAEELLVRQQGERQLSQAQVMDVVREADAEPEFMELDSADAVEEASPVAEIMEIHEATGGYEAAYHLGEEALMKIEEEAERVPAELWVTSEETERVFEEGSVVAIRDEEFERWQQGQEQEWDQATDEFAGVGEEWRGDGEAGGDEVVEGRGYDDREGSYYDEEEGDFRERGAGRGPRGVITMRKREVIEERGAVRGVITARK
ncbi:hypothetical protein RUND412_011574, partial [Rhizina undulata]